jgi:hypothetical protein
MDCVGAARPGYAEQLVDVEIGIDRAAFPTESVAIGGGLDVARGPVFSGVHGNRPDVEVARRAEDAQCDLAAVGDKKTLDGPLHQQGVS